LNFTVVTNNAEWVEQFSFFYVLDGQDYRYSSVIVEDIQKSTSGGEYYYKGQANLSNLSDGSHSLIVFIGSSDVNGVSIGIGTEAKVNFAIEPEPFPTTLVATASGVSAALVCLGLLVYFKKRKR
jgi:hypothetical protein